MKGDDPRCATRGGDPPNRYAESKTSLLRISCVSPPGTRRTTSTSRHLRDDRRLDRRGRRSLARLRLCFAAKGRLAHARAAPQEELVSAYRSYLARVRGFADSTSDQTRHHGRRTPGLSPLRWRRGTAARRGTATGRGLHAKGWQPSLPGEPPAHRWPPAIIPSFLGEPAARRLRTRCEHRYAPSLPRRAPPSGPPVEHSPRVPRRHRPFDAHGQARLRDVPPRRYLWAQDERGSCATA